MTRFPTFTVCPHCGERTRRWTRRNVRTAADLRFVCLRGGSAPRVFDINGRELFTKEARDGEGSSDNR